MRNSLVAKFFAVFLALLMVIPQVGTYAAGEESTGKEPTVMDEVLELLDTQTYEEYLKEHNSLGWTDSNSSVIFKAAEGHTYTADKDYPDLKAEVVKFDDVGDVLYTPDAGSVSWTVNIPEDGYYVIWYTYRTVETPEGKTANTSNIQRKLEIDGKTPFKEANYFEMTRTFTDNYFTTPDNSENGYSFKKDVNGNDKRPTKTELFTWRKYFLSDYSGFHIDPFKFALTKGEHTFTLIANMNEMYLDQIAIEKYDAPVSYEEYLNQNSDKANASNTADNIIKMEAEYPSATSDITIFPLNDRTSPITSPQDPSVQKLNTIGGAKWQNVGQWIEWTIPADAIKESGYYYIVPRYLQNTLQGLYASRRILINGEVPFDEANYLQFNYSDDWQCKPLSDGTNELKFYFEAGKEYTIKMEVVFGNMTEALRDCQDSIDVMNDIYNAIIRITGPTPDENMDYGFAEQIYDTIQSMHDQSVILQGIVDRFKAVSGGSGEDVATIEKVVWILQKMSSKESEIAKNLENLKLNAGTLGTWIMQTKMQAITFDYIQLQPVDAELPKARAGFFEVAWFEIRSFFQSFITDYNSLGSESENIDQDAEAVELWISTSRDEAQVMRELVDTTCPVKVNLKLVAAGSLLPATLAGTGPDISLATGQTDVINYAIRNAIEPLSQFSDYHQIVNERFDPEMLVGLKLENPDTGEYDYFGIPERLGFLMMFYRKDIFAQLGLEVPETWDDLDGIVPDLNAEYKEVGMTPGLGGLQIFMYQLDEGYYRDEDGDGEPDGMRVNFDSNVALDCFERLCELFTTHKFPRTYDLATRFRMGEIPIAITDYLAYNQFSIYATEIKGLWEFVPIPGTIRTNEDGTTYIDRSSPCTVSAVVLMADEDRSDTLRQNCWEFMKWWTDAPAQSEYAKQYEAIIGLAAKYNTANVEALGSMPWTNSEKKNLEAAFEQIKGTPEFPGGYIISRYVEFAFLDAYNNGTNPVDAMLDNIIHINNELTRKRGEFGLKTYEEVYGDQQ